MPQLDLFSFLPQIILICAVFLIVLIFNLTFVLPTILATLHARKFLSDKIFSLNSLETNNHEIVIKEITANLKKAITLDLSLLKANGYDKMVLDNTTLVLTESVEKKKKLYLISPFVFIFESDFFVLVFAFFISFCGLFLYFYYNVFFEKQEKNDYLVKINNLKKQITVYNLPSAKKLFK